MTPRSRESVTCPAAWNESSAIGHRSRKLTIPGKIFSLPEENVPGEKGLFETLCVETRLAAMAMKDVWMKKEMRRLRRRREVGGFDRPVGYRWRALKKREPRQKAPMEVNDL